MKETGHINEDVTWNTVVLQLWKYLFTKQTW